MTERTKFVLEWNRRWNEGEGHLNFAELCREYGVARPTGYLWVKRFRDAHHSVEGLAPRSSRPKTMPTKVPEAVEDAVIALRKARPHRGPKKLRRTFLLQYTRLVAPAQSTIGDILRRHGLSFSRRRRARPTRETTQPFAQTTGPNATWCVDFKGHFALADGRRCYPLTLIDAYSRFLLRCEALVDPDGDEVMRIFDSAFQEFGLPAAIRSDNGPPFAASKAAGGLTKLAVWWLRLGVRLERIEPGKPQQNGRQERFHRTLKAEAIEPGTCTLREQQRTFDLFRREYNEERPHESLGQETPDSVYLASARTYPRPHETFDAAPWQQRVVVDRTGHVHWRGQRVFISSVLADEPLALEASERPEVWNVYFGPLLAGRLLDAQSDIRFRPCAGRMQNV